MSGASPTSLGSLDVSRETIERLENYEALLQKWNPKINLVSKSTLEHVWDRHFVDSAQIFPLGGVSSGKWLDIGSGGGFPGLVVAIIAAEKAPGLSVTCIESDQRKAAFLNTVKRELGLNAKIIADRVEKVEPQSADVLSARALAPLSVLLNYAERHLAPTGKALFMKGANPSSEMAEALENWTFSVEECPSETAENAAILILGDIRRA